MNVVAVLCCCAFFLAPQRIAARSSSSAVLVIGDTYGWTHGNPSVPFTLPNYIEWTAKHRILPGDRLIFYYLPSDDDVHILHSKKDFDSCVFSNSTLLDGGSSGVYVWKAPMPSVYYFACSKNRGAHCRNGQKIMISVAAAPPPAPSAQPPIPVAPAEEANVSPSQVFNNSAEVPMLPPDGFNLLDFDDGGYGVFHDDDYSLPESGGGQLKATLNKVAVLAISFLLLPICQLHTFLFQSKFYS